MPTFRPDIREISPYLPGRPISEVAREHGVDPSHIIKLASNENPLPPFPQVEKVIAEAAGEVNRYPDNDTHDLRRALAERLDVSPDHLWIGGGSSELLRVAAIAAGGPGTSAVYAWPSFVIYRLGSILGMADRVEVPLSGHLHDLEAMRAAVRDDTTIVYVCNPNNPTGTLLSVGAVAEFVESLPERILVVVDEAYHEYVTNPGYSSALPLAVERPNVLVTRTFSKIYGLAALRVGYAVAQPETVMELRKAQAPFTVSSLAQLAAIESLRHPDQVAGRVDDNTRGRARLEQGLAELGVEHVPSHANFVYFRMGEDSAAAAAAYVARGVIVRAFGRGWLRVSVGTETENERFLEATRTILQG